MDRNLFKRVIKKNERAKQLGRHQEVWKWDKKKKRQQERDQRKNRESKEEKKRGK